MVVAIGLPAGRGGSESGSAPPAAPPAAVTPTIPVQPAALTLAEGDGAALTVRVSGSAPPACQRKRGGVDIAGATASTCTLAATTLGDDGAAFTVTVTNSAARVTSSQARPALRPRLIAPGIKGHPSDVAAAEGAMVSSSVTATGSDLAYPWQRNDVDIPAAAGPTSAFAATAADNGARLVVVVSNAALVWTRSHARAQAGGSPAGDAVGVVRPSDDRVESYPDADTGDVGCGRAVCTCESGDRIDDRLGNSARPLVAPCTVEFDRALTGSAIEAAVVDADGDPVWRRVPSIGPSGAGVDGPSTRVAMDAQGNVLAGALAGNLATVARPACADGAITAGAMPNGAITTTSNGRTAPGRSMDGAGNVYAGIARLRYRCAPDFANGIALNIAAGTGVPETRQFAFGADTAGQAYGTVEPGEFTSNADLRLRHPRYP